jgi:hypothetical protein
VRIAQQFVCMRIAWNAHRMEHRCSISPHGAPFPHNLHSRGLEFSMSISWIWQCFDYLHVTDMAVF